MEVSVGKVVDGKVVVEGGPLPEGTRVTVLLKDDLEVRLTPEQVSLLRHSAEQAERGEVVDGWDLLREISSDR